MVEVTDVALQLETETSERGQTITNYQSEALPLVTRNYSDLLGLMPGSRQAPTAATTSSINSLVRAGSYNVNGQRSMFNNFLLDGLDNNAYGESNQGFDNQIRNGDTAVLIDTTSIKIAIGAAQSLSDTAHYQMWTLDAVKHYPRSAPFCKLRGGAFEQAGQRDSAIVVYQKCAALDPKDLSIGLLVAKAMVDRAVYDTARSRQLTTAKDTANLRIMQEAFAARIDSARAYVQTVLASSDTTQRLSAAVILLTAGSKLAQAAAYERAFPWLDQLITEVAQRSPADTTGPRQAIRVNGSFWYGLSSTLALNHPYQDMIKSKSCTEAKAINDRLVRTRAALLLGGRVAPNVATQMLGYVGQYDANMPKVKKAFKCTGW